jgi:hypothetical protein
MGSPPQVSDLQGASRMTGGVLRGRAQGNIYNNADSAPDIYTAPRKGRVFIYQSPRDPKTTKPDASVMSEVTPQLKPVLKTLARRFSPVSSKSYFFYVS